MRGRLLFRFSIRRRGAATRSARNTLRTALWHGRSKARAPLFRLRSHGKLLGIDSFAYLRDVLERLPSLPAERVAELGRSKGLALA